MELHKQANNAHTQKHTYTHMRALTLFPHHHRSFSFKHRSRKLRERVATATQKQIAEWSVVQQQ